MGFLDFMLKKLTDNYNKSTVGNIGKVFCVVADELEEVKVTLETIERYRDIDQAVGYTLDRIGRNVLQAREQMNDDDYRQMIKTKIRANMSPGDIETVIEIADALLGDNFTGIQEVWSWGSHPHAGEPAGLLLFVRQEDLNVLPYKALKRVVAAGVSIYFQVVASAEAVEYSSTKQYIVHISTYQACGTFSAGGEYEL